MFRQVQKTSRSLPSLMLSRFRNGIFPTFTALNYQSKKFSTFSDVKLHNDLKTEFRQLGCNLLLECEKKYEKAVREKKPFLIVIGEDYNKEKNKPESSASKGITPKYTAPDFAIASILNASIITMLHEFKIQNIVLQQPISNDKRIILNSSLEETDRIEALEKKDEYNRTLLNQFLRIKAGSGGINFIPRYFFDDQTVQTIEKQLISIPPKLPNNSLYLLHLTFLEDFCKKTRKSGFEVFAINTDWIFMTFKEIFFKMNSNKYLATRIQFATDPKEVFQANLTHPKLADMSLNEINQILNKALQVDAEEPTNDGKKLTRK